MKTLLQAIAAAFAMLTAAAGAFMFPAFASVDADASSDQTGIRTEIFFPIGSVSCPVYSCNAAVINDAAND